VITGVGTKGARKEGEAAAPSCGCFFFDLRFVGCSIDFNVGLAVVGGDPSAAGGEFGDRGDEDDIIDPCVDGLGVALEVEAAAGEAFAEGGSCRYDGGLPRVRS